MGSNHRGQYSFVGYHDSEMIATLEEGRQMPTTSSIGSAHRVQYPGDKINHALVFGGNPGIGKDTIAEPLKPAVGWWNFHEISAKQIFDEPLPTPGWSANLLLRLGRTCPAVS
jgi:hypothetical protein